jgi:sarcosine oxidase delta subunit
MSNIEENPKSSDSSGQEQNNWTQGVYIRVQAQGMDTSMALMWRHFLTKSCGSLLKKIVHPILKTKL